MAPKLLTHLTRVSFVVLCVLVLTRVPLSGYAAEAAFSGVIVEETVMLMTAVVPHAVEDIQASTRSLLPIDIFVGTDNSHSCVVEHSVLRL